MRLDAAAAQVVTSPAVPDHEFCVLQLFPESAVMTVRIVQ
jgi:hypothetical protein